MLGRIICAITLPIALPLATHAQPALSPRVDVAVREVVLSNGERRYAVPMTVGGVAIEAGLDTGSVGLRVLGHATTAMQVVATTHETTYSYGSGTRFKGIVAKAPMALGDVSGTVPIDIIQIVDCRPNTPDCPAAHVDAAGFGIQGDGLPGAGFVAIFGINMGDDEVPNPLVKLGVKRWIVELPKPGDTAPGHIVLNPTVEDMAGFVMFPLTRGLKDTNGGAHDAIDGCLRNLKTRETICGALMMDSGAPGIRVVTADHQKPWPEGDPAQIIFVKDGKPALTADFTVGRRDEASRFTTGEEDQLHVPHLYAGLMPYFAVDVLYDPEHDQIGLKAR